MVCNLAVIVHGQIVIDSKKKERKRRKKEITMKQPPILEHSKILRMELFGFVVLMLNDDYLLGWLWLLACCEWSCCLAALPSVRELWLPIHRVYFHLFNILLSIFLNPLFLLCSELNAHSKIWIKFSSLKKRKREKWEIVLQQIRTSIRITSS